MFITADFIALLPAWNRINFLALLLVKATRNGKKMATSKLWIGARSVPKGRRQDTKKSQSSTTRTALGGFKSCHGMDHAGVQTKFLLEGVKYLSDF